MITKLLILLILVWPFGQLLQLTSYDQLLRVQLLDVLIVFLFLSLMLSPSARRILSRDQLLKPLALFLLAAAFSLVPSSFRGLVKETAVLYLLRFLSYTSVYFALRLASPKKIKRYLVLAIAIFISLGFLQYLLFPDLRFLQYLGFDDHLYRLTGTLLDPNFTGLVLAVFVLLALALNSRRQKLLCLIPLTALAFTFSRASFVALSVGLIYLMAAKKQLKFLIVIVLLGVLLYFVPKPYGEGVNLFRTFSITSRLDNQMSAIKMFLANPIIGIGFNTLATGIDNSFLFVLVTTGLIGFVFFIFFVRGAWNQVNSPVAKSCLVVIFIHSLFNNSFFYTWNLCLFFVLIGWFSKRQLKL